MVGSHRLMRATTLPGILPLFGMSSLFMSCILAPLPKILPLTEGEHLLPQVRSWITYETSGLMPSKSCQLESTLVIFLQDIIPHIFSPLRTSLADRTDFASLSTLLIKEASR